LGLPGKARGTPGLLGADGKAVRFRRQKKRADRAALRPTRREGKINKTIGDSG